MALSAEMASLFVSIGVKSTAADELDKEMTSIKTSTGKLSSAAKAGGVAAAAGITAIAGGIALATNAAADYETKMAEVFTLMPQLTGDARDQMSADVLDLSKTLGVTTDELVPALYQAISAGVPSDNVFTFLETANKAAIGGVTDLETAVDGITSVVNAYGSDVIDAAKASDLMFTAVKLGKTNFEQLSNSLFNVIPTASALGVEFGDITAALAAMTAQGTPTSVATTQLRQALVELSKDGSKASEAFKLIANEGFADFIAEGNNLQDALVIMQEAAENNGVAINDLFGSVEAGNAVLALTGKGAETFTNDLNAMAEASGATNTAFETMDETAGRTMEKLKAEFSAIMVEIGNEFLPILKDDVLPFIKDTLMPLFKDVFIPAIKAIAGGFAALPTPAKAVIAILGGIVAALAPLMLILGPLIPIVTTVLPVALAALTGPIGLVILAIAGLVVAGKLLYDNWDMIVSGLGAIWEGLASLVGAIADRIVGIFTGMWNTVKGIINFVIDGLNMMIGALNSLRIDVPDWVPFIGGQGFGFNIATIPRLAKGGELTSAGSVMVGENGPEVLSLPQGASVTPLGAGGITINMDGAFRGASIYADDDKQLTKLQNTLTDGIISNMRARGVQI